jgi:hypothetical protein
MKGGDVVTSFPEFPPFSLYTRVNKITGKIDLTRHHVTTDKSLR